MRKKHIFQHLMSNLPQNELRRSIVLAAAMSVALGAAYPAVAAPQATNLPTREQVTPTQPELKRPRLKIDASKIETAPCPLIGSEVRVAITSVEFTGNHGPLDTRVANALNGVGPRLSGEQSIEEVCYIRDVANAQLKAAGFIATAQIVPQDLTDGVLHLNIVTAHIKEMRVHGDPGVYRALLDERIEALRALNPLNQYDAEKILLLTGDIPGLDLSLSLRSAGTEPGELIGDLNLGLRPYRILSNVNNYGSSTTGPESGFVRAELYGLTGRRDMTYFGASLTNDLKEQKLLQFGHIMGLTKLDDSIAANFTIAETRPSVVGLDLRTETTIVNLEYALPVRRTVLHNLRLSGGLDIVEQKSQVYNGGDSTTITQDKLRIAYIFLDSDWRAVSGGSSLRATFELRQGLDISGATRKGAISGGATGSHFDGDAMASVARGEVSGVLGLGPIFSLSTTLKGQYADRALLSYEEYSVGNLTIGRGYEPGSNAADQALALKTELRARLYTSPHLVAEGFGFADAVRIWNYDAGTTENNRNLTSYGIGLRLTNPGRWVGELIYAHPNDKALSFDKAPPSDRLMVSFTYQFNPEGQ